MISARRIRPTWNKSSWKRSQLCLFSILFLWNGRVTISCSRALTQFILWFFYMRPHYFSIFCSILVAKKCSMCFPSKLAAVTISRIIFLFSSSAIKTINLWVDWSFASFNERPERTWNLHNLGVVIVECDYFKLKINSIRRFMWRNERKKIEKFR